MTICNKDNDHRTNGSLSASVQLSTAIQNYSETNSHHSCCWWTSALDFWFVYAAVSTSTEHNTKSEMFLYSLDAASSQSKAALEIIVVYWCELWQLNKKFYFPSVDSGRLSSRLCLWKQLIHCILQRPSGRKLENRGIITLNPLELVHAIETSEQETAQN